MPVTSSPFKFYNAAPKNFKLADLLTEDIRIILLSSSYTPNDATHEFYNLHITNELATANGYTNTGQSLTTKTLTAGTNPGDWVFKSDNPLWTASGAGITAMYWAMYVNLATGNKPLIGYGALNDNLGSPVNVVTASPLTLSILVNTNGWFGTQKVNGV
jgi:hypothetical protein